MKNKSYSGNGASDKNPMTTFEIIRETWDFNPKLIENWDKSTCEEMLVLCKKHIIWLKIEILALEKYPFSKSDKEIEMDRVFKVCKLIKDRIETKLNSYQLTIFG